MKTNLKIEGMSCGHCVSAVTNILSEVKGVKKVSVSIENKEAIVTGKVEKDRLIEILSETPYKGS